MQFLYSPLEQFEPIPFITIYLSNINFSITSISIMCIYLIFILVFFLNGYIFRPNNLGTLLNYSTRAQVLKINPKGTRFLSTQKRINRRPFIESFIKFINKYKNLYLVQLYVKYLKFMFILTVHFIGFISHIPVLILWSFMIYFAFAAVNGYFTVIILLINCELISFVFIYWIACKNEHIKKILYDTFGKDFLIDNLGNPGRKGVTRVIVPLVAGASLVGADTTLSFVMECEIANQTNSSHLALHKEQKKAALDLLIPRLDACQRSIEAIHTSPLPPGFLDSFSNGREALEFRLGPLNERELFLREEISKVLGSFLPEVVKPNMDNVKPRMALVCYDLFKDTCTNISFNKKP